MHLDDADAPTSEVAVNVRIPAGERKGPSPLRRSRSAPINRADPKGHCEVENHPINDGHVTVTPIIGQIDLPTKRHPLLHIVAPLNWKTDKEPDCSAGGVE
jgi:hypothetical protein